MLIDQVKGYQFYFRSGGVVVLKGNKYIGFYDSYEEAFKLIFGDKKCLHV